LRDVEFKVTFDFLMSLNSSTMGSISGAGTAYTIGTGVVIVVVIALYLDLPVQLVPTTTKVSSQPADVSDIWQVGGFLHPVSSTNKTHRHDIAEILLKVALS
jgi:hypothetical protein